MSKEQIIYGQLVFFFWFISCFIKCYCGSSCCCNSNSSNSSSCNFCL